MQIKNAPSDEYPFGTDAMGRCVMSRLLYGARTSIFSALALVIVTAAFGSIVGILCGFYSGAADRIVMRIIDGIMAFPQMVLAIAVAGILGGGMANAMLALGFASWTPYARLARSRVISLKNEDFIQAARLSGCNDLTIMLKYILPNIFNSLLTFATTQVGTVMLGFAGLSFLNLGVQLPQAEWGSMISEARGMLGTAPWTVLYPALALVLTVMVFNYLGDAVCDKLDV
ncbi:MAG: ABC transporter permease [Dethiobacteria bacterium]